MDPTRAYDLYASFNAQRRTDLAARAFRVGQRIARGPEVQRALMASRSRAVIEGTDRQGLTGRARRKGITVEMVWDRLYP